MISVETTARLHMGFIDMNGGLGRRFGSLGLAIDQPALRLNASLDDEVFATGPESDRVRDYAARFLSQVGLNKGASFTVLEAIPPHSGLGSGTQLALATGMALNALYQLNLSVREIAAISFRGARSGIGLGVFESGGFVVDGGRGTNDQLPPVISRLDFPDAWRILLVYDARQTGVHGVQEKAAFSLLPEFSASQAAHISRLVLMQVLPAIAESDIIVFGNAISEIQRLVGDFFSTMQGGGRYSSKRVGSAMAWLGANGVTCTGQSSWGPTGFAVMESERVATEWAERLKLKYDGLDYKVVRGRNTGSKVSHVS